MALKDPVTVLITGATSGIGGALARCYARPGRTLILHGRDAARLDAIALDCDAGGARVIRVIFDLRDPSATEAALRELSSHHAIDLAIINAGVSRGIGTGEEAESWEVAKTVLAVNLDGAIASIAGVLPAMRRRGTGQIAIVSSLAGSFGLPISPIYCASKAAVKVYGEALRGWLAPQGVTVNVVLPGFVQTPLSRRFPGPKPWLMSSERASTLIRHGLERDRARIAFPRLLAWGMWWLTVLPVPVSQWLVKMTGYGA